MLKDKKVLKGTLVTFIILVIAVAIAYVYMICNQKDKVQERVQKVCVLDTITKIDFKSDNLTTLIQLDGNWINPSYKALVYDQEKLNEWVNKLLNLETFKIVKNVENESSYGITEKSPMITIYDEMNNSQTLYIGHTSETEQGMYIKTDKESKVYMVPLKEGKVLDIQPETFVDLTSVELPKVDKELNLSKNGQDAIRMVKDKAWYIQEYYNTPYLLNEEVINKLITSIDSVELLAYVGTQDDLKEFGLNHPRLELILGENKKISFGNDVVKNSKRVYISFNGLKDVYEIDKSLFSTLNHFNPFEALEKCFIPWNASQIKQIQLANPQGEYKLVLSEDGPQFNDRPITKEEAEAYIEMINQSLYIEAPLNNPKIEQNEQRKAEATIQYLLSDGQYMDIELIPYDSNYYILRYNGSVELAVNKDKIINLFIELNKVATQKAEETVIDKEIDKEVDKEANKEENNKEEVDNTSKGTEINKEQIETSKVPVNTPNN